MKNNRLLKQLRQGIHGGFSLLIVYTMIFGGLLFVPQSAQASVPSSGTLNADNSTVPARNPADGSLWMGDKTGVPPAANGESDCAANPQSCDNFILSFSGDFTNKVVRLDLKWLSLSNDYDLYVHKGSLTGQIVASSTSGPSTFETVQLNPAKVGNGPFYVNVVYFATPTATADQYRGFVNVEAIPPAFQPPPTACTIAPTYKNFQSPYLSPNPSGTPTTLGERSGEPSIGVNWNTGNVMFQANLQTLRVTFDDNAPESIANWVNRSFRTTTVTSLDPIMFTDPVTGRTIPGQLAGGNSLSAITDDDGETYTPNIAGGPGQGIDHQTIGGGPFKTSGFKTFDPTESMVIPTPASAMVGPTTSYPRAFYYASQQIAFANFSTSRDGGNTYDTPRMMYNTTQCSGLHGHITVAPNDGTIYVPNKNCPGGGTVTGEPSKGKSGQGFAISEDNGNSFAVRTVPNSGNGDSDPSVAVGAGGKVYFAYTAGDKTIHVAVSDDKGVNFKFDQNIGLKSTAGLSNDPEVRRDITATVFPQAIAGDNDRATVFFLGTDSDSMFDATGTDGEPTGTGMTNGTQDDFAGTWFPFMATTCNGGQSWTVIRAADPVQQGVICTNGTTCPSGTRNLLDFNGVVVDRRGRAIAGYADGCINRFIGTNTTTDCTTKRDVTRTQNDMQRKASIIRQTGGFSLFSAFDPTQ